MKTGEGRTVAVAKGKHADSCPVAAWLAWKAAAGIKTGPAFRAVDLWGNVSRRSMSPDACRLVVARAAERAGIEHRLTGHSMCAGLITTARKERKRVEKIREQSGHAANSPVFREHVCDADRWDDTATDGIGL